MSKLTSLLLAFTLAAVAAEPPRKAYPFAYQQHDFPNGLRLVTVPTDFPNVVSLYIVVQVGSRNEIEPGKTGFAHFFEHMMFRGTKLYPPDKVNAILREAGAAANANTSDDRTVYHTTFSKPDLETIIKMEADRFQNLDYSEADFRTEALAVLGEYNKNSAAPTSKLFERLRDLAYEKHTYKHTTMGFLADIQDMPNQFAYSKQFFDRYYRPEYTTVIVVGDVTPAATQALVEKYWGSWKHGTYRASVPVEPASTKAREDRIDWPSPTLPWVAVAYHKAAYSDSEMDNAVLDLISFLGFSENSPLYRKLVLDEQKVDTLAGMNPDSVDPALFTVMTRVKKEADMAAVQEAIQSTLAGFKDTLVSKEKLEQVKSHLRYEFALGLDNSESIAQITAAYVALARTPETINRLFDLYAKITPEDIRTVARKYFVDTNRTVVTLTGGKAK